jgi:hypothetical protein
LLQSAKKKGKDQAAVQKSLEQLEALMPNLINLNKMKPADWVRRLDMKLCSACVLEFAVFLLFFFFFFSFGASTNVTK